MLDQKAATVSATIANGDNGGGVRWPARRHGISRRRRIALPTNRRAQIERQPKVEQDSDAIAGRVRDSTWTALRIGCGRTSRTATSRSTMPGLPGPEPDPDCELAIGVVSLR